MDEYDFHIYCNFIHFLIDFNPSENDKTSQGPASRESVDYFGGFEKKIFVSCWNTKNDSKPFPIAR